MSDGYRKSVQDKYFSDDRGILYRRDPLKDSSGCADTPIANFTPELVEQRRIDDGFEIKDTTLFSAYRNGTHEPPVALEKKDMISNQPHAKFSPGCRIYLGRGYTASVGEMMAMQCEDAEVKTVYAHTGFVKCGDQRIFLNGDYSVTSEGLTDRYTVELDPDLKRCYRFIDADVAPGECFKTLLELMPEVAPNGLLIPSLAYVFLSPLNAMLRERGMEPSFSYYLIGKTGSYKSSWAKVLLCFFGKLNYAETAPITFLDTKNAIGRKLALGCDMPLLLDDRRPTNNSRDREQYEGIEKFVSSAIGDRAARGRLNADSSAKMSYIARCNLIVTAEEAFQNIGSSAIARSVSVELQPDTVNFAKLMELQDKSVQLNKIMQLYIQWIIRNYDSITQGVEKRIGAYRQAFSNAGHPRLATAFAYLSLGYDMLLDFLKAVKQIDDNAATQMQNTARGVFLAMCEKQSERVDNDRPTKLFVSLLHDLLETKQVKLCDLREQRIGDTIVNPPVPTESTVGYRDGNYIYLIANVAYTAVYQYYSRIGNTFPASPSALWKQFADEGKLLYDGKRVDRRKQINGKTGRYITLLSNVLDEFDDKEE